MTMKKLNLKQLLPLALAATASHAWAAEKLSVEVGYGFVGTSSSGIYTANPDTSFVIISNTGDNRFTGSLSLTGISGYGVYGHIDVDDNNSGSLSLAPGESWTLFGGPEASNYGGYNKCQTWVFGDPNSGQDPNGPPDSGLLLTITGTLGSAGSISYSIYDHEIHSGTSAVNPFGVSLDNYILQGGDPFGRDTGDAFEEAQAHAFFEVTGDRTATALECVPECGSATLIAALSLGAWGLFRWKRAA
jgi:hypothetical protein